MSDDGMRLLPTSARFCPHGQLGGRGCRDCASAAPTLREATERMEAAIQPEPRGLQCSCRLGERHRRCPLHGDAQRSEFDAGPASYERGGYVPHGLVIDAKGLEAVRHSLPPLGERIEDAKRRIYEADARLTNAPRPTGGVVGLDAMLPPLSPAAMLGEAADLLRRADALLRHASQNMPGCHVAEMASGAASNAVTWTEDAKREAEAREGT